MRTTICLLFYFICFSIYSQDINLSKRKVTNLIVNEDIDSLEKLINHGLDINKQYRRGETLLHIATYQEKVSVVKWLIQKGADVNIQSNNTFSTPLNISSFLFYRNDSISELLIKNGAKSDIYRKISPLQQTIFDNNEKILKLLLDYNADVNAHCEECCNRSAFLFCCYSGNQNLLNILIDNNADYTHLDCDGENGLMYAIEAENIDIVKKLIQLEYDFNQADNKGKSILDYALKTKNTVLIEIIEEYIK
ncbi:ankyrin repeat domain-containing protein [Bernardetia sp. ABR2-2B]|uniref:ankyrin repeat domain-containing protein n=1 Tax=Bernardetia sp. ABR2-2B TaxID=3127472 RepID=UPI0030D225CF